MSSKLVLAALFGASALLAPTPAQAQTAACAAGANGVALGFVGELAGVSSDDHRSSMWTGRVSGGAGGALRMTLEPLGDPIETANPVWNVRTRWTVWPAAPGEASLVAALYGTVNWKTGVLRVAGVVSEGGCVAAVDGRFARLDASGTLEFRPLKGVTP